MKTKMIAGLILAAATAAVHMGSAADASAADAKKLRVIAETTATGFGFPESVAYDPAAKVLYVSNFGGSELKPGEKDGNGRIAKVSLDGKILESRFLPEPGDVLNKPKGLWVVGNRLWVTDIDVVWVFDLKTRKGRKVALPGVKFANDPAVKGNVLYVSDSRADQLFSVEPADFLNAKKEPKVSLVFSGKSVDPNGVYPAKDGSLLVVGLKSNKEARGIYSVNAKGEVKALSKDIGMLDGLYQMNDGTILATDWNSGTLFSWSDKAGMETLASGFKGPADFCVIPQAKGYLVVVPDLVKSELRFVRLGE
jgi:DNA-binding beta-propeller fold protein YncE